MTWDLVVLGSTNTDFIVRGAELPRPGQSAPGGPLLLTAGGKGANQAAVAALLGARVALISCVGEDERGEALIRRLGELGVETSLVSRTRSAETGAVLYQVDSHGASQRLVSPGANAEISLTPEGEKAIRSARMVSIQLVSRDEVVERALRLAREAGALTAFDPSPWRPFPEEWLRLVTLLRANAEEGSAMTGIEVRDRASARRAAQVLRSRGAVVVALQAGEEGNLLLTAGQEVFTPRIRVEAVNRAGAGDAYTAVLAVAMARGEDLAGAAPLANAAAAMATLSIGAQDDLPDRRALDAFLKSHRPGTDPRGAR